MVRKPKNYKEFAKITTYIKVKDLDRANNCLNHKGFETDSYEDVIELSVMFLGRLMKKIELLERIIKQYDEQLRRKEKNNEFWRK